MNCRVWAATSMLLAGCISGTAAQSPEERNRVVVLHLFERVWNDAHFDSLDAVWAPDVPFHFRGSASLVGPAGVIGQVTRWRTAFPDFHFIIEDIVAEEDRIAVRLTFTGTHSAPFLGIEPTGRRISVTEMMFFRLRDGVIIEAWEDYDAFGLRQQLTQN